MFIRLFILLTFLPGISYCQDVLFTVAGEGTTVDEFLYTYQKNQDNFTRQDVDEYLDLYINFKLKVHEARGLGMDTLQTYKSELESYKRQLVQPYLTEKEVSGQLLEEAYQRLQEEVSVSHILLRLPSNPTPQDTTEVYSRAIEIFEKATPQNFAQLAAQYSEEPGAASTQGYLGYFTALQMVYPFETASYSTQPGGISKPIQSRFGYHIVFVRDKRPSRGKVEVSHIMIRYQRDMTGEDSTALEEKIWEVHQLARENYNWDHLVKSYSDDINTKDKGGVLPVFGVGEMLPEILNVAFSLDSIGQVSDPLQTNFGWHLLRLENTYEPAAFDEVKSELERRIQRDSRSEKSVEVLIARLKRENGYQEYPICDSLRRLSVMPSDSIVNTFETVVAPIARVGNTELTSLDFVKSIAAKNGKPVHVLLEEFLIDEVKNEEIRSLPSKYPEYGYLLNEYQEGILLFDIMTREIWEPAEQDSINIEVYYQEHLTTYRTPERATLSIFEGSFSDSQFRDAVVKYLDDSSYYKKREQELAAELDLELVESGTFDQDVSEYVREPGVYFEENRAIVVWDHEKEQTANLEDIRGRVIADYQEYKEEQWVNELRSRYVVEIKKRNLKKIYKQLEI